MVAKIVSDVLRDIPFTVRKNDFMDNVLEAFHSPRHGSDVSAAPLNIVFQSEAVEMEKAGIFKPKRRF